MTETDASSASQVSFISAIGESLDHFVYNTMAPRTPKAVAKILDNSATKNAEEDREASLPAVPPIVHLGASLEGQVEDEELEYVDPPPSSNETMGDPQSQDITHTSPPSPVQDTAPAVPPASNNRSLGRQTTASFIAAGGSPVPTPIQARNTRGRQRKDTVSKSSKKVLTDAPPDPAITTIGASDNQLALARANDVMVTVASLQSRIGLIEAKVASLEADHRTLNTENITHADRIAKALAPSILRRNPDFMNLYKDHLDTRNALNTVSSELSSHMSSSAHAVDNISSTLAELEASVLENTRPGPEVPAIVLPPSSAPRPQLPPRTNGFLTAPHPQPGIKRKERDWEGVHPDRLPLVDASRREVRSPAVDVTFGPVMAGDVFTRGMDVIRDSGCKEQSVMAVHKASRPNHIVITFVTLDEAQFFIRMVRGNLGGKFAGSRAYIDGPSSLSCISTINVNEVSNVQTSERLEIVDNNDIGTHRHSEDSHVTETRNTRGLVLSQENPTDVILGPLNMDRDLRISNGWQVLAKAKLPSSSVLAMTEAQKQRHIRIRCSSYRNAMQLCAYVDSVTLEQGLSAVMENNDDKIHITMWNCNGYLAASINTEAVKNIIKTNDIALFQETFLAQEQEGTLALPPGYNIVAQSRDWLPGNRLPGGGVAAIISDRIKFSICEAISHPDIIVIELDRAFIICAYVVPENSWWGNWTVVDPKLRLAEAIDYCCSREKGYVVIGDLNARTGSRQATHSHLDRQSPDLNCSARGSWLLDICEEYMLHIVNGTGLDRSVGERWTSYQPNGNSVVDYAIVSEEILPLVDGLLVEKIPGFRDDHASIHLVLGQDVLQMSETQPPDGISLADLLGTIDYSSPMEQILHSTLQAALSDVEATTHLYGPAYFTGSPVHAYLAAVNADPYTVFAVNWGLRGRPLIRKSYGALQRGYLMAMAALVLNTEPTCPLIVYTCSRLLVTRLVESVGGTSLRGWPGTDGDLLRVVCTLLARRSATTEFRMFDQDNKLGNQEIDCVLKTVQDASKLQGTLPTMETPSMNDLPEWDVPITAAPIEGQPKIYRHRSLKTNPKIVPVTEAGVQTNMEPCHDLELNNRLAHRGRAAMRNLMWRNLQKAVNLASEPARYWRFLKEKLNQTQRGQVVTMQDLRDVFENRMNPPKDLPSQFDAEKFRSDKFWASNTPQRNVDMSHNQYFARTISSEEIDIAKRHLSSHTGSTMGIDGIQYSQIMQIPSDQLAKLFNFCISTRDAPTTWLRTKLVGILKPGKAASDPESYRLIALECCFLKMMTLLVAQRFRDWVKDMNILPEAQNGFREGFRTSNCAFVLRCAIDRARALDQSLLVTFIDLENAFPSTNLPTLWKKLADAGAEGPLMDWVRMIYECMRYSVTTNSKDQRFSELFQSLWGILAGDTLSPDLFTFYAADCDPPKHRDDVRLFQVAITYLLLADDMAMMEYLNEGAMKEKLAYMANVWCRQNFLKLNVVKTKFMIFGPLPASLPVLRVNDSPIDAVSIFKYVGFYFQSTKRNIFAEHYAKKAKQATAGNRSFYMLESIFGSLWPKLGLQLYMARVDPHLTHGCEVAIDVDPSSLLLLEKVQLEGLRRILGLGPRCMKAVLFTESGIMPIAYRRLILALRYLSYLSECPMERFVRLALEDSKHLLHENKPCWLGDLIRVLRELPHPVEFAIADARNRSEIEKVIKKVEDSCARSLHDEIENSERVPLLLGRLQEGDRPGLHSVVKFRPYLCQVNVPAHRLALTRFMCAAHGLAVEKLRHAERHQKKIPRMFRLCRLCKRSVEDELHAVLLCEEVSDDLMRRRIALIAAAKKIRPKSRWDRLEGSNGWDLLRMLCRMEEILPALAAHVYHTLKEFAQVEIFRHPEFKGLQ